MVQMITCKSMTSFHYSKMSQLFSRQITSELTLPVKETVDFNDSDKFAYLFEHTCSIYKDAMANQKYLDHSPEI